MVVVFPSLMTGFHPESQPNSELFPSVFFAFLVQIALHINSARCFYAVHVSTAAVLAEFAGWSTGSRYWLFTGCIFTKSVGGNTLYVSSVWSL